MAESESEAEDVARNNVDDGEFRTYTYEAISTIDMDWCDALPFHERPELPDKTCAEWLEELKSKQ